MAGQNQITGGEFQDYEGHVLANGYLTMQLSHDGQQSVGPGQVCAGLPLRVPLDANGNIAGTVLVWPNDQLNPANSYYVVNAFRRDGVSAWAAPQFQTVTSSPSPFNVGVWVPNNPPSGGAPVGSILLQNNGVNNASQSVLNLESTDSSVTITDEGSGTINLQAKSVSFSTPGFGGFWGPGLDSYLFLSTPASVGSNIAHGVIQPAGTVIAYQFTLPYSITINRITTQSQDNTGSDRVSAFGIYNASSNLVLNGRTWAGLLNGATGQTNTLPAPVTLSAGIYWHAQGCSAAGSTNHFFGYQFPGNGTETEALMYWVKNATRAALAANGLTACTVLSATATSASGSNLTLTGSWSNPAASGQYVAIGNTSDVNSPNNGNWLCTASGANTLTVTNPNGVTTSSGFEVFIGGTLPATLGTLTPFVISNINGDGVVCPFYEP